MLFNLKKQNSLAIILLLLTIALFWIKSFIYLDPDFGYRLRNGQIILQEGIDGISTDPYSYTMPSYRFVEHSWMSALVIVLIYSGFGMGGAALAFSIIALASLVISVGLSGSNKTLTNVSKAVFGRNLWYFGNPLFLLSLAIISGYVGVRVQVISWLFLSILVFIGLNEEKWEKYKVLIPPLFLFWVNLHASFFEGIFVLLAIVFFKTFNFDGFLEKGTYKGYKAFTHALKNTFGEKKVVIADYLVLFLSLLLTLVNPYGVGAWRKVLLVASDTSLRWEIMEWMPSVFNFNPSLIVFGTFSVMFVLRYLKKFRFGRVFIYFFIFAQGVSSLRHIPLWLIIALPTTNEAIGYFYQDIKKIKGSVATFRKAYKIFWTASAVLLFINITISTISAYYLSDEKYYPKKAVDVLRNNLPEGEVFSSYGWGGYLSWKLPEKKVFISGLMPVWRYDIVPEGELESAYKTYSAIVQGKQDFNQVFNKFDVDTVLWHLSPDRAEGFTASRFGKKLINLGIIEENFSIEEALKKDGWIKVYQDDTAVIYKRYK